MDECTDDLHDCHADADCTNNPGEFDCACKPGYEDDGGGDGRSCLNIDECASDDLNDCHIEATCTDKPGTFECDCNSGFKGNGTYCEDIDEPTVRSCNCHTHATCTNTYGGFICTCNM